MANDTLPSGYTRLANGTIIAPNGNRYVPDNTNPGVSMLSSLFEYANADDIKDQYMDNANRVEGAADPFGRYRPYFGGMLSDIYHNPSSFQARSPAYNYTLAQTEEAINRANAASGNFFSGNRALALQDNARNLASLEYDKEIERLGMFGGAQFNPAHAQQLSSNIRNQGIEQDNQRSGALGAIFGAGSDILRGVSDDNTVWGGIKQTSNWLGDMFGGSSQPSYVYEPDIPWGIQ